MPKLKLLARIEFEGKQKQKDDVIETDDQSAEWLCIRGLAVSIATEKNSTEKKVDVKND